MNSLPARTKFPAVAEKLPAPTRLENREFCAYRPGIAARNGVGHRRVDRKLKEFAAKIPASNELGDQA
jgi:hypothetical protein